MKQSGAGAISVTGSSASERGLPMNVGYVASKHAVSGSSRAVASEAAAFGVRCNCIIPGSIDTPMSEGLPPEAASQMAQAVPQGRAGAAAESAEVAAFSSSDAASHVTAPAWAVDGGMSGTMRPVANSLKSMIPLKEKGLAYESVYVDSHKFEQHQPWFTAINPEGQVPVLDHDGTVITHTTVINEYRGSRIGDRHALHHFLRREIDVPDFGAAGLVRPVFARMHQHEEMAGRAVERHRSPPAGIPVDVERLGVARAQPGRQS
ncbi:hypothetical protein OY671_008414, partial [Metschnikowia pulcherrima]